MLFALRNNINKVAFLNKCHISKYLSKNCNVIKSISSCHYHLNSTLSSSKLFQNSYNQPQFKLLLNILPKYSTMASTINNLEIHEVSIPMPWGTVQAQIMGKPSKNATPILCLHGYLDNSNSFKPLAPYICKEREYYMIVVDFPGHGFSSRLPDGIPYTPKLFLSAIRRVVNYLKLKDFVFLSHSYGISISVMYDTVFKNEVKAIIAIDWVFSFASRKWSDISTYWKEGIDEFIKAEDEIKDKKENGDNKREPLTKELAASILLKANRHLDKESAMLLIERALVKNASGNLEFSRDIRVKKTMSLRDHYVDFKIIMPEIIKYLSAPVLMIHADPPSYGEQAGEDTMNLLKTISESSNSKIELTKFKGTHHFHMIHPKESSILIHSFLDKIKINPSTKL